MKAHHLISIWLPISICLSLVAEGQTALGGSLHQDNPRDTLKLSPKYAPKKDNTFKLLPKYDQKKDTAGFQLIPKQYNERGTNDSTFVPYDREPQIIKKVEPKYPEPALRAGLEGKVIVKMWVTKEGKVDQVVVLKSDAEIFNQPAIEAAKQFTFTPAYMNRQPVALWVSYPFRFKLPDKK